MNIADWANFFVAEVGASAALTGLVVVATSINLSRILSFPQLPARAAESLMMLTGALVLASFGLMPGQTTVAFGVEILAIGLVTLLIGLYNQVQSLPSIEGLTPQKKLLRAVVTAATTFPFIIGGFMLILGFSDGLYWAGIGLLISLAAGVWNAWILLIEIMR
jgi:hypothetical protein